MNTIYILPIEPIETRYTKQWYDNIPKLLEGKGYDVVTVDGVLESTVTTPGAFLNFTATNIWKNTQINEISRLISDGKIINGDKILVTDAWDTGILQLRYMFDLLGLQVSIHAIWHAGSYDPQDFLGRLITNKEWTYNTERALFQAIDYNYFATEYHKNLFLNTLFLDSNGNETVDNIQSKTFVSGQPHDLMVKEWCSDLRVFKKNQIIFPHRIAPEKQPEIIYDLKETMTDIEFVICQETKLTKSQYHKLINESKVMFSASLQETLGIGQFEAACYDTLPIVPNRLSYSEIMNGYPEFLYDSEWTIDFESYKKYKNQLVDLLYDRVYNYEKYIGLIEQFKEIIVPKYMTADNMISNLLERN